MTLIDKVAQLRALEQKATQSEPKAEWEGEFTELFAAGNTWKYEVWRSYIDQYGLRNYIDFGEFDTKEDADLIAALRNAAPALLEVLQCFQSGDTVALDRLISFLELQFELFDEDGGNKDLALDDLEIFRRLVAAARRMEAQEDKS